MGRRRVAFTAAVLALTGTGSGLAGQSAADPDAGDGGPAGASPAPAAFEAARVADVDVDGALTEGAWSAGAVIPLPYESNPGDNTPAPVQTRCRVAYDASNLYLACRASDPDPDGIRAFITDRDDIDTHDRVVFTFDPFSDGRRAFEFGISALGVQSDAVFDQQGSSQNGGGSGGARDDSWDAIWSSAGRITADGYEIEAAIPFKSLRFPSTEGVQTWGFYVRRHWPRSEDVETRSMIWDRSNACELCQANRLNGLQGIQPGRNVQLTPAVLAVRTDSRAELDGRLESDGGTGEVGLDAMWGVTSNLTVNLTLNPDFSQVEADAPQVDVNNRFALFFPEKRAFFLEGADYFGTPMRALFTRTIVAPSAGGKVTGKVGANVVGAMVARDDLPTLILPGPDGSDATELDGRVLTGAFRIRRDVGASSNVGLLLVTREGDRYYNRVAGADGVVRPFGSVTLRGQYLHSETSYAPGVAAENGQADGRFAGDAGRLELVYSTRDWWLQASADRLTDGFRADAGFITQVGVNRVNLWLRRTLWGDDTWYTRINLNTGLWHNETTARELLDDGLWFSANLQGPAQSSIWFNPNLRRERYEGVTYTFSQYWMGGGIRPSGALGFEVWANVGGAVDYANARPAEQVQASPELNVRVGRKIDLQVSHTYTRLFTGGETIVEANVSQLRGVYNFSPRTFFRVIVQQSTTSRDPRQYEDDVDRFNRGVLGQVLLSYKLNPQSVLFLGYGDAREARTAVDFERVSLTQTDRMLFVKASYAWRP